MVTKGMNDAVKRGCGRRALLRALGGGALVLLGGGAAWLGGSRGARLFSGARRMMGTQASVLLAHDDPERAARLVVAALDRMEEAARMLTRYDPGSEIGRVNARPGASTPVSADTDAVVGAALAVARASDGAFDPGLDRLTELWGFHAQGAPRTPPTEAQVAPWRQRHAYRSVQLTRADGQAWLRIADPAVALDLGGIAKGFAIDAAVAALRQGGVRHALVEAGGDLYALGGHPAGGDWPIGVRHPRDPGRLLAVLSARNEGVATSGDYERYFEHDGRRYAHLMDPRSGRPADRLSSLTVRAASAMLADAWATAGFVAQRREARRMLGRVASAPWLAMDSAGRIEQGARGAI
jgi:thiamine biosynthesis lipoprotein